MAPYLPLLLLFFSTLMPFSNGGRGKEYEICSVPSSCGPVKDIQYPFWLEQTKPEFCGLPDFKLECRNPSHYPHIMNGEYRVHSINTATHTIVVDRSGTEVCFGIENSIPKRLYNGTQFFNWGATLSNLTLFLDCPNDSTARFHNVSFTCSFTDGDVSVYYLDEPAEVGRKCQDNVTVLVSRRALNEFMIESNRTDDTLLSLLEAAAEMKYDHVNFAACSKCQNSGGICGSSIRNSPSNEAIFECYYQYQGNSTKVTIKVAIPISIVLLILLFSGLWICMKKRKGREIDYVDTEEICAMESLLFDINTIKAATRNFSIDNKLEEGGFGEVYKGTLESGQEVAVKRLLQNSKQGAVEFKTEVDLVAKPQHKNLVKLLGFCMTSKEKILVYEFLPNSSLDKILSDPTKNTFLNWRRRLTIIIGIARGLMYLHEDSRLKVIHRDLKTSNILLDEAMNPKISDFGLAKLFVEDQTQGDTKRIVGTYGYMAPEYAITGHYSVKSDVYSFGVIVLEIISGQKNRFFGGRQLGEALLHRAWRLWSEGKALDLVDTRLNEDFPLDEVMRCFHIGLLSIQEDAIQRPRMRLILDALSRPSVSLPEPKPPRFFGNPSDLDQDHQTLAYTYTGIQMITDLYPRD